MAVASDVVTNNRFPSFSVQHFCLCLAVTRHSFARYSHEALQGKASILGT